MLPKLERRRFLAGAGLAAGALAAPATIRLAGQSHDHADARPFVFPDEPPRRRKSFYDLTDVELRLLCRAVGHMRNGTKDDTRTPPIDVPLSVDSPLQWDQWVMTHARHCTEAGPDAPQVHWSWFFLPWHRAYLFFLERQLANIVTTVLREDGSQFALPYWDWITHKEIPNTRERQSLGKPSPLFGYDLDKESMNEADNMGFDNMALWDGYRAPTLQAPTMNPANEKSPKSKEEIADTIVYMSRPYIDLMLQLPWDLFMGKSKISREDGMGVLEHYPHNNGHDWVGSRQGKNRDMGTLRYAALDPIFFMHHANIDRIWSWYRRPQPDPDSMPEFGNQQYTFTDLDGQPVTVTVRDIVKRITNVNYVEPQPAAGGPLLMARAAAPPSRQETRTAMAQEGGSLTPTPLTFTVQSASGQKPLLQARESAPPALAVLEIQTGPIPYSEKFSIKVFANKPNAGRATSIRDATYVGRIRVLDSQGRQDETGATHTFPILLGPASAGFLRLVRSGAPLTITLVPDGPIASRKDFAIQVRSVTLRTFE